MRILPLFIPHAGCLNSCVFCNQYSTSAVVKTPSFTEIKALIDSGLQYGPLDEVAFYGGSFTALEEQEIKDFLAIVQPYISAGDVGGVRVSTRPDAVDVNIVEILKEFGVTTVELGCQSFSDRVLECSGRGHVAEDSINTAVLLREGGFRFGIQLMPGLPGGDRQEALHSLDVALTLAPDFLRIYPTVVLAGTLLAEMWQRGEYTPLCLEPAVELCAEMDLICRAANVPVIRYGLQENDALATGSLLAGPYHPAFGQLVRSRVWRHKLSLLKDQAVFTVAVNPADYSDAIGHKRDNLEYLCADDVLFTVRQDPFVRKGYVAANTSVKALYE